MPPIKTDKKRYNSTQLPFLLFRDLCPMCEGLMWSTVVCCGVGGVCVCVCEGCGGSVCVKLGITRTQLKTKLGGGGGGDLNAPGSAHNWYENSSVQVL
jgi:hypothetical protein